MKPSRWLISLGLAFACAAVPAVLAQQNAPRLGYVLPAGGRPGTTIEVKVGGQFLQNVGEAYVTGGGVQAAVTEISRPMTPMQAMQLRERVQELQKQPASDAVRKEMADVRVKLLLFNMARNTSPVLSETLTLQITLSPEAVPGRRELRVMTPQGLSNPLAFCIGQLPEFSEKETININMPPGALQPQISQPATDMFITLPATVNGRIKPGVARGQGAPRPGQQFTPGDVDRYRFQARQGQRLVIAAGARELIPYLADAVPGWFQAVVALYDASGKELAYEDDYQFRPDPVLHYVIPKDGEYSIEIKDAIYRGREDFVYRISLGELPFVTGIFPLGGPAGSKTSVQLRGWNLPADKTAMDAAGKGPGIYPLSLRQGDLASNTASFMVDTLPESFEKEPNDAGRSAQKITLPHIFNGRIDRPGDADVFSFTGRAGDQIIAEVYARRLDSPLDSTLRLTDASGRQLAFNDDHEDKASGLNTHHADSFIMAAIPADGTYYVHVADAQQKGGPEYAYRLRIGPPRPDFELRVTPSGINAGAGMTVPITVYALRKDGFAGDISLSLKGAPRGFVLAGGLLPAGQDSVRLTLTAPPAPLREPLSVNLEGSAIIQGREVRHPAVPAEDMMQAFAYRHLVPASELKVAAARRGPNMSALRVISPQPMKLAPGGTARILVRIPLPPNNPLARIGFELSDPPEGIRLLEPSTTAGDTELVLQCDPEKAKVGMKGNLIVTIYGERRPPEGDTKPRPNQQRVPLGTLPAIPFEIVKENRDATSFRSLNGSTHIMIQ